MASYKGHVKVVEVLLYAGADINLGETVRLCVHMCVFSDTLYDLT